MTGGRADLVRHANFEASASIDAVVPSGGRVTAKALPDAITLLGHVEQSA